MSQNCLVSIASSVFAGSRDCSCFHNSLSYNSDSKLYYSFKILMQSIKSATVRMAFIVSS